MSKAESESIRRATGLLVIEVKNSNPNGDPDRESDPRTRSHDQRGVVTGVSFKRKLRDLVDNKEGEVWKHLGKHLAPAEFDILEARRHKRQDIEALLGGDFDEFKKRFWDARLFGNTFLEEGGGDTIRSGVAHFPLGISVSPVRIERLTMTKMAPAQGAKEGKEAPTRGMAPLGCRVVEHGIYAMPFFINPTSATKSGCTNRDIRLLLKLIPFAYPHTASTSRPYVDVRYAWYVEHNSPLGSCSDFEIIEALAPKRKGDSEQPSSSEISLEDQYDVPKKLNDKLQSKLSPLRDLCQERSE